MTVHVIAQTEHMVLTMDSRWRVWCSQYASCRWAGYRSRDFEKPCPKCGGRVTR
jgi:ssDNA-binding Zn-finger/Zn-ribbon topoisomerase 1